jgi:hypothetical protein
VVVELTPVQQHTLDLLARSGEPVVFDTAFVAELLTDADAALVQLTARMGDCDEALWVSKHGVDRVLTCEAHWATPDSFHWTPATARGAIAHRAVQLSVHWTGDVVPVTLVDEAIERICGEERGIADWLNRLGPADGADLRARSVEYVTKFLECFPQLDGKWFPVTESTMQYPRVGSIVLRARVDLTLGRPRGRESSKVIIDVKTGRLHQRHREDLRFYALIETLSRHVPPRLLVTYSLDSGSADREETTEAVLRSSLRRTLDAIERMVEIRYEEREPKRTSGPACRWCPLRNECSEGQAWIAAADGDLDP